MLVRLMEIEKFYGKIVKIGDSAFVLVPSKILKYTGLQINENVVVYIKRRREENGTDITE
jgi:putative transposon-encoded protein